MFKKGMSNADPYPRFSFPLSSLRVKVILFGVQFGTVKGRVRRRVTMSNYGEGKPWEDRVIGLEFR